MSGPSTMLDDHSNSVYGKRLAVAQAHVAIPTATTRVQLSTDLTPVSGVYIKALAGNGGLIYVGDITVAAANGYELSAGEEIFLPIGNLSQIYVDTDNSGDDVCFIAV